jgi:NAD(P)-dependent dehydrogenase (short-subunit alcohol dehydrogenase family)
MNKASRVSPAIVVTGVSSGIGLAIAEDLLQRGYQVFGSVRRSTDADWLAKQWGTAFVPLIFDVTDTSALPAVVAQVEAILNGRRLAALVNNAGIGLNGPLEHQPMAEIRLMFEINVFGALEVTRAFLPLLGRRGTAHRPGRIVNISSVSGRVTVPFMGAYSASKHALEALTQGLRRELKPFGIEASTIEPGFIQSRIFDKELATKPMERYKETDIAAWWQQFNRSSEQAVRHAKSTDVVTHAVRHAIESGKPRTRYPLDFLCFVGRWFSDRMFDRLIFKLLGFSRLAGERSTES